MQVQIGAMRMKNPVMVASGTFGYGPEYADLVTIGVAKGLERLGFNFTAPDAYA